MLERDGSRERSMVISRSVVVLYGTGAIRWRTCSSKNIDAPCAFVRTDRSRTETFVIRSSHSLSASAGVRRDEVW